MVLEVFAMAIRPEFGIFPTPDAARLDDVAATVRLADDLGLDLVGIQDHPYQRRFVDTFAVIASLAARTRRIRFFPDVANLPLRGAAMLAKQAATIDLLSGGRFELGLGAGGFWNAIRGMGGPDRSPGAAVDALEEAIAVIRALWSTDRGLHVDGEHYRLDGIHGGPQPAHDIGIWLGAVGPRMLAVTGRLADGWVPSLPYVGPARLPEAHERIDEAAAGAGRDPAAIHRVYNISGTITDGRRGDGPLDGPVDQWVDTLARFAGELRMDAFVLMLDDLAEHSQLRRLAEEILPGVRDALGR
jgi:alkanesulfonate monooxygenase SsuD/methylene tetrahydromethanopterin reductase-like flavin-dependent oxidoreductase (luciferase family)